LRYLFPPPQHTLSPAQCSRATSQREGEEGGHQTHSERIENTMVKVKHPVTAITGKFLRRATPSYTSIKSIGSALSILSLYSIGSILSIGSAGSILSIGSAGSILSIGSAGSILSIGGAGTILGIGGRGIFQRSNKQPISKKSWLVPS
jgi:hypothetical protein